MRFSGTLRRVVVAAVRRASDRLGYDLVQRTIYSPIPRVPRADAAVWTERSALAGVDVDLGASFELLESELAPYLREFDLPETPDERAGFHLWNGYYQAVDAEVLYAMIRHLKPRRVLEIGSGYSTYVTASACLRNAAEGAACDFVAIDPEPRTSIDRIRGLARIERALAQDVPLERFVELGRDDVLFIDSSHSVKLGSDVNFLVLDVLPRLRPGVVVHVHDIFLPYEYPRAWYARGTFVTEQYLLQAFLIGNRDYRILFAAHAAVRADRRRVEASIPSLRSAHEHYPAALWLVRTGGDASEARANAAPAA